MTQARESWFRFFLVVALLAGTGLFLRARGRSEDLPARQPLAAFPVRVGEWVGTEVPIQASVLVVLGAGEFLERTYRRAPEEPFIDFFLGYFPTQRAGSTIHSPQNCLPGSGWAPIDFSRMSLALPDRQPITINRYLISKGLDRQLVLYWYQAHGRVVASEYFAKFFLMADAIRSNRSDGALVRVMTPLAGGESVSTAQHRAVEFVRRIVPELDSYIPR